MDLLIDTHVLVWAMEGNERLSASAEDAITAEGNTLYVSGVTAWEFADLRARRRLPAIADFGVVEEMLSLTLLDLPAQLWRLADALPNLHGDPLDRLLMAHAIHADLTIVTADQMIWRYPVRTLW